MSISNFIFSFHLLFCRIDRIDALSGCFFAQNYYVCCFCCCCGLKNKTATATSFYIRIFICIMLFLQLHCHPLYLRVLNWQNFHQYWKRDILFCNTNEITLTCRIYDWFVNLHFVECIFFTFHEENPRSNEIIDMKRSWKPVIYNSNCPLYLFFCMVDIYCSFWQRQHN